MKGVVPEVLEAQGDAIDTTKSEVAEFKRHVIAQTIWRKDIDEELSLFAKKVKEPER